MTSWRQEKKSSSARGYGHRWKLARAGYLRKHPLCIFCERQGRITAATVVDHIVPHKGDMTLFWDSGNWQPLCKHCHDSVKARMEAGRDVRPIGLDGWPIDENNSHL